MALTNIELYEVLKGEVSEKAARMIAEVLPSAQDLATKSDLADLKAHINSRMLWFMLAGFVPVWLAVFGMLGVIVAKL